MLRGILLLAGATVAAWPCAAAELARVTGREAEPAERGPAGAKPASPASPTNVWTRDTLTGSWDGWREALAERGVTLGLTYSGDVWGIVSGGVQRRAEYVSEWDLTLTIETEPLLGWRGGKLFVYGLGLWRTGSPSEHSGDFQALDENDAPNQWRLYEAWLEQEIFDGRLSLLAGLYDVSREFDVTETAGLFIHSSFGTGRDFSQSGVHGPSIFPATSLGVRLGARPHPNAYARVAVLDGVPGDPDSDTDPAFFSFSHDQGVLTVGEVGYVEGEAGGEQPYTKLGLGGWYYSGEFDRIGSVDANGDPRRRRGNYGMYLLGERVVYREPQAPNRGLALFARVGFADAAVNRAGYYVGGGAVYTGLLRGRPDDRLGLGVAAAIAGHAFERASRRTGSPIDGSEVAIELTYRARITPWLSLQPDIQYIINPGFHHRLDNAVALGGRFEIVF